MRENHPHVLLLDDDADDRALARLVIEHEMPQLAVEEITDAPAFAQACGRRSFDLVILEQKLQWSDGLAILAVLQEDWPEVPVILFTRFGVEQEDFGMRGVRVYGLVEDVTARREAEGELARQAQKSAQKSAQLRRSTGDRDARENPEDVQQFATLASHELQEPVRMMERYTQLLREDFEGK